MLPPIFSALFVFSGLRARSGTSEKSSKPRIFLPCLKPSPLATSFGAKLLPHFINGLRAAPSSFKVLLSNSLTSRSYAVKALPESAPPLLLGPEVRLRLERSSCEWEGTEGEAERTSAEGEREPPPPPPPAVAAVVEAAEERLPRFLLRTERGKVVSLERSGGEGEREEGDAQPVFEGFFPARGGRRRSSGRERGPGRGNRQGAGSQIGRGMRKKARVSGGDQGPRRSRLARATGHSSPHLASASSRSRFS